MTINESTNITQKETCLMALITLFLINKFIINNNMYIILKSEKLLPKHGFLHFLSERVSTTPLINSSWLIVYSSSLVLYGAIQHY